MPTVLVVDDDVGVRQIIELVLKQKGFETISACNGLEGLMVYSSYRANVDLVLTDIDMPEMNGLELAERVRDRDPVKKILMMSGRSHHIPAALSGVSILPKPFRPDQLIAAVDSLLNA